MLETNITVAKAYGQYAVAPNMREILFGCDILCATPGRLMQLIDEKNMVFNNLHYFILDECDRMLKHDFLRDVRTITNSEGFPPVCFYYNYRFYFK